VLPGEDPSASRASGGSTSQRSSGGTTSHLRHSRSYSGSSLRRTPSYLEIRDEDEDEEVVQTRVDGDEESEIL
jgi:hypothetical protein